MPSRRAPQKIHLQTHLACWMHIPYLCLSRQIWYVYIVLQHIMCNIIPLMQAHFQLWINPLWANASLKDYVPEFQTVVIMAVRLIGMYSGQTTNDKLFWLLAVSAESPIVKSKFTWWWHIIKYSNAHSKTSFMGCRFECILANERLPSSQKQTWFYNWLEIVKRNV